MKQKSNLNNNFLNIAIVVILVSLSWAVFGQRVQAVNTSTNCVGGVCGAESDDLPQGATGIDPNTTVNLSFTVANGNGGDVQCRSGSLYHFIVHYIAGSSSNYEYTTSGSGPEADGQFNSGSNGQANRYSGVFYCSNSALTGSAATINSSLGILYSSQLMWQTPEFNLTTRAKTTGMMVVASPDPTGRTYAPGQNLTLTVQNGADPGVVVYVGGTKGPTLNSSDNFTNGFNLTQANGFNQNGQTTLQFYDASNNSGSIPPGSMVINVSPSATSTAAASSASTTVDCSGPNPDPNYCLYNPLPVDSLTSILLLIMQWLLGILGVASVFFIVIGGFRYIMSQGNEEAVAQARKTITWAVVGFAIAILAFSIMAIVQNLLKTQIKDVNQKTSMVETIIVG